MTIYCLCGVVGLTYLRDMEKIVGSNPTMSI